MGTLLAAALWISLAVGAASVDVVAEDKPPSRAGAQQPEADQAHKSSKASTLVLEARHRPGAGHGTTADEVKLRSLHWDPKKTAIIVCDMWDDHTCKGAAARVAEMAPAMNRTLQAARDKGVFIIHAPSGQTSFYQNTPQRRRALESPKAKAPVEFKWNYWNPEREGEPLAAIVDGGCGCQEPCAGFEVDEHGVRKWKKGGKIPWTRQIDAIEIALEDAISDNGQEIYNLLQERHVENVILMGVHTNICVSGRPFGLRQMVYLGKNVVLCRDLTDGLFQAKTSGLDQFRGTELIVEHIERRLCPTITSASLTGEKAFRFKDDTRNIR